MLRSLGRPEVDDIIAERGDVEVGCEFCGQQYRFDPVDVGEVFTAPADHPPGSSAVN
jgi:molecular chaperone Hsp33